MMSGGYSLLIIQCICILVTAGFLALRLYISYKHRKTEFMIGDIMVVLGWAAFMAWFGCNLKFQNTKLLKDGGRFHSKDIVSLSISDISPNDTNTTIKLLKIFYGSFFPYWIGLWCVKGAFISFYYKFIPKTGYRRILHTLSCVIAMSLVLALLLNALWCVPVKNNWKPMENREQGRCLAALEVAPLSISLSCNLATNLLLVLFPLPFIRNKKFSKRQQFAIVGLFGLGLIFTLISIARAIAIYLAANAVHVGILTSVEMSLGVVVSSSTVLRVFFSSPDESTMDTQNSDELSWPPKETPAFHHNSKRNSKRESILGALPRGRESDYIKMGSISIDTKEHLSRPVSHKHQSSHSTASHYSRKKMPILETEEAKEEFREATRKRLSVAACKLPSPILPPVSFMSSSSLSSSTGVPDLPNPPSVYLERYRATSSGSAHSSTYNLHASILPSPLSINTDVPPLPSGARRDQFSPVTFAPLQFSPQPAPSRPLSVVSSAAQSTRDLPCQLSQATNLSRSPSMTTACSNWQARTQRSSSIFDDIPDPRKMDKWEEPVIYPEPDRERTIRDIEKEVELIALEWTEIHRRVRTSTGTTSTTGTTSSKKRKSSKRRSKTYPHVSSSPIPPLPIPKEAELQITM